MSTSSIFVALACTIPYHTTVSYLPVYLTILYRSVYYIPIACPHHSCTYDVAKTLPKIDEEHVTAVNNICAALDGKAKDTFKKHSRGFMGNLTGPLMVAFGHGHPDGYGVGPDVGTGCMGYCIFVCCCCCQPPGGKRLAKMKSDFNYSVKPIKGQGIAH